MSKKLIKILFVVISVPLILYVLFYILFFAIYGYVELSAYLRTNGAPSYYETQDIADYGIITGTNNNEEIKRRMESYFPVSIEENFQNVKYVYHAESFDDTAVEAYLEFTIEDEEEFDEYVKRLLQGRETTTFRYDESFQEYVLWDFLFASEDYDKNTQEVYWDILAGCVQKVLINEKENRLIYVLIFVGNGDVSSSKGFWCYFDRFDINPEEYWKYTKELIDQNPAWLVNDLYAVT